MAAALALVVPVATRAALASDPEMVSQARKTLAVFEKNVAAFPASWNVHDSLAEAYAEDGQKQRAITAYEKSLALNPGNANGAEQLRKLRGEEKPK